eukprot:6903563-Alexandrium_andersonii.AAC.1
MAATIVAVRTGLVLMLLASTGVLACEKLPEQQSLGECAFALDPVRAWDVLPGGFGGRLWPSPRGPAPLGVAPVVPLV